MDSQSWDDRIKRAEALAESQSFARDPLNFYRKVLLFQKNLYTYLCGRLSAFAADAPNEACPLHGGSLESHLPLLLAHFPSFVSLIRRVGSPLLSETAARLSEGSSGGEPASLLQAYWSKELIADQMGDDLSLLFFPKAFLQPYAEFLAEKHKTQAFKDRWEVAEGASPYCPLCNGRPQVSILRSEGDGAKRMLLCSACFTEWRFKRVQCAACGEESFGKLPYHTASDFPHVRVEVCETCHKYIKGVDLTVNGLAVPLVDDVATLPLDIWAAEQGYDKIEMNLVGA